MSNQYLEPITRIEALKLEKWLQPKGFCLHNINHKFADATKMAQLLKQMYPKKVELHNYSICSATSTRRYNWNTLNDRVLRKIGLRQNKNQIDDLSQGTPGAIEHLLLKLISLEKHARRATKATMKKHETAPVIHPTTSLPEKKGISRTSLLLSHDLADEQQVIAELIKELGLL